ncbi:MAG: TetR/AcrR family transcriptional regulator [Dehalobacter sp. 4CP]|uniref:TetR/AcrR family transcriptional regulator n=1 Tax=Dehalobacter sp. CP TaxID=2594474 RepID=UPI0013C8E050|nr:TetR/AcrR family transcriptional regulator [Dehalobacter sp. 4CP]
MGSSNETKQKLINVTRHMVNTNGIDSVSMRDLGKETKLSRSAVYRHFKNKDDLLAAIVTENFETLKSNFYELIGEISDPRKLVFAIFYNFYDYGIRNQEHYQLMFHKPWNKKQHPNLCNSAAEVYGIMEKCVGKAQEQKCTIRMSRKQLTAMVSAFIVGLIELSYGGHLDSEKGFDDPTGLINSFLDIILV